MIQLINCIVQYLCRIHPLKWAGETVQSKLQKIRAEMRHAKAGALLVTMLDDVAYLYNLRGSDIGFNPVFISYSVVTPDSATLYVDQGKVTPEVGGLGRIFLCWRDERACMRLIQYA